MANEKNPIVGKGRMDYNKKQGNCRSVFEKAFCKMCVTKWGIKIAGMLFLTGFSEKAGIIYGKRA